MNINRIHQRKFDADTRPDLIVNCVNPGYVNTAMSSHKGHLTADQGNFNDYTYGKQNVLRHSIFW